MAGLLGSSNNPISGVTVTIIWEVNGVNQTSTVSGTTKTISGTKGAVTFSISSPVSGSYKIYVLNAVLSNYDYDSTLNTSSLGSNYTVP